MSTFWFVLCRLLCIVSCELIMLLVHTYVHVVLSTEKPEWKMGERNKEREERKGE